MPDLSAYINFSVALDNSLATPVIRVTDTGTYPNGILPTITGKVSVTQADGVTVDGTFTDIVWTGSGFANNKKAMRLATDNKIQRGSYKVSYTVRCTGYDDTILVKVFYIDYSQSLVKVTDFTDAFMPKIQLQDDTDYEKSSLNLVSITRAWNAGISTVNGVLQSVQSVSKLFNISYANQYYDAAYLVDFTSVAAYNLVSDTTISVIDKIVYKTNLDVYAPPTLESLLACVSALTIPDCNCGSDDMSFSKATILYQNYINSGVKGITNGLDLSIAKMRALFNCDCSIKALTHTNSPMAAYQWQYVVPSTGIAPQIVIQPQSANVNIGGDATLLVVASGSQPLRYQWQVNAGNGYENIEGGNSATLVLTNMQLNQSGTYRAVISNTYGSATSSPSTIAVTQTLTAFYWYGSTDPYPALSSGTDGLTYQVQQALTHNQPLSLTLPSAGQTNMYGVLKIPIGEITKTAWYNTPSNNGQIPDAVWYNKLTIGQFDYYITRVSYTYVAASPVIFS